MASLPWKLLPILRRPDRRRRHGQGPLHPVAGRQVQGFTDLRKQPSSVRERLTSPRYAAAAPGLLHGGGLMVHADENESHGFTRNYVPTGRSPSLSYQKRREPQIPRATQRAALAPPPSHHQTLMERRQGVQHPRAEKGPDPAWSHRQWLPQTILARASRPGHRA